jgi:hypothetical protein
MGRVGYGGKDDSECRARLSIFAGANVDDAVMPLKNFSRHPQAETGSDILLGGEEGLEDSIVMFLCDSGAVIFDLHLINGAAGLFNALKAGLC